MKGHLGETGNRTGLVLTDKEAAACPENQGQLRKTKKKNEVWKY